VFLLLLAPACSWCVGLGLFKTVLALGLLHRYAPGGVLPGALRLIGSNMVFWPSVLCAATEVVVDMIPNADVRWNRWNGKLRVIGGFALALLATLHTGIVPALMMGCVGAFLALVTHGAHTGARLAAAEAGTNKFVTPVTSVTETCMIFATLLPLSAMPQLTFMMLCFTFMAACLVTYLIWPKVSEAWYAVFGMSMGTATRAE
jgi:hypothetical protein